MICGTANGKLLPPMVVYKSLNLYKNWTTGGPNGTVYGHSKSGWFDMTLFEKWFFKILLPHVKENPKEGEEVVVIGDNLASHFPPDVIKSAIEKQIYMTHLPPESKIQKQFYLKSLIRTEHLPQKELWTTAY